jgi:hypothetical protein
VHAVRGGLSELKGVLVRAIWVVGFAGLSALAALAWQVIVWALGQGAGGMIQATQQSATRELRLPYSTPRPAAPS